MDYELQQSIIDENFKKASSEGAIFDINQEEVKLNEKIHDKLINSSFQIVDTSQIRLTVGRRNQGNIVFEDSRLKLNVVVEYLNRNAELTHFYSILKIVQPEVVIFYSPSTTLLRGLYLFCAEDSFSKYWLL